MVHASIDMPTILYIDGWRLFFYSNEGHEPIHVHAEKGGMACKYWIQPVERKISLAWSYHMNGKNRRDVERIIIANLELIIWFWLKHFYL